MKKLLARIVTQSRIDSWNIGPNRGENLEVLWLTADTNLVRTLRLREWKLSAKNHSDLVISPRTSSSLFLAYCYVFPKILIKHAYWLVRTSLSTYDILHIHKEFRNCLSKYFLKKWISFNVSPSLPSCFLLFFTHLTNIC